jgi:hypothetical protein
VWAYCLAGMSDRFSNFAKFDSMAIVAPRFGATIYL